MVFQCEVLEVKGTQYERPQGDKGVWRCARNLKPGWYTLVGVYSLAEVGEIEDFDEEVEDVSDILLRPV